MQLKLFDLKQITFIKVMNIGKVETSVLSNQSRHLRTPRLVDHKQRLIFKTWYSSYKVIMQLLARLERERASALIFSLYIPYKHDHIYIYSITQNIPVTQAYCAPSICAGTHIVFLRVRFEWREKDMTIFDRLRCIHCTM